MPACHFSKTEGWGARREYLSGILRPQAVVDFVGFLGCGTCHQRDSWGAEVEVFGGRKTLRAFRWSRPKRFFSFLVFVGVVLVIAGCATQPRPETYDPHGFFSGLLHGFLILFSFIGSWFWDVRIYAFPNSGGWYDFGYLIGASMFLGGGGASSH